MNIKYKYTHKISIKMFDEKNIPYLPCELVDIIADFVDYEKYSKPKHYELLKGVINDIGDMASIMPTIIPNLVWQCWGPGVKHLPYQIYYDN
tara:strand:- start:1102 stop:1377 length:276 start_codon:yes stop_codon:yes gene_type:complete